MQHLGELWFAPLCSLSLVDGHLFAFPFSRFSFTWIVFCIRWSSLKCMWLLGGEGWGLWFPLLGVRASLSFSFAFHAHMTCQVHSKLPRWCHYYCEIFKWMHNEAHSSWHPSPKPGGRFSATICWVNWLSWRSKDVTELSKSELSFGLRPTFCQIIGPGHWKHRVCASQR